MAGSAVIGALRVNLGIDSAQFSAGVKRAQSTLGGLSNSFKQFAIGAAAALSFGAVTKVLSSAIDHMDELSKASQKIGIPVEALSKLEFAAKLADVGIDQLQIGVGKLSKAMAAIQGGQGGDAGKALAAIGVSAVDAQGKLRPTEQVIGDIAEKFAGMQDGAGKTALALAIFGKSGADLIPLLNAGRQGLADSAAEAQRLGLVIGGPTAQAAETFNDNLTRLQQAGVGFINQAIVPMLPLLVDLTNAFVSFVANSKPAITAFFADITTYFQTTAKEFNAIIGFFDRISNMNDAVEAAPPLESRTLGEINGDYNLSGSGKTDREKTLQAPKIQVAPILALGAAAAKVKPHVAALSESFLQSQFDAKHLNDGVLNLSASFPDLGAQAETLGDKLGQTLGQNLQTWFGQAIDGTFKFKDALSGLLSSLAKVAGNNLISGLLGGAGGNPLYGGGGGGIFAGLGKLFGFASGGTIMPGGSGGIDSQLVAFRKSPNERVDISKPGQSLGSGGTSLNVVINAQGADAGGLAMVRMELQNLQRNLPNLVKATVTGEKTRNPAFAR